MILHRFHLCKNVDDSDIKSFMSAEEWRKNDSLLVSILDYGDIGLLHFLNFLHFACNFDFST